MLSGQDFFSCSNICLKLGGRDILSDVSISATESSVLGVIGPNGAGKTSLFEVLSGRLRQNSGLVKFKGTDLGATTIQQRLKLGIGRTFQTPVVPNSLTVEETLRSARKAFKPFLPYHRGEWALDLMNFKPSKEVTVGSLDTLDRRKLLLTCLLMRDPKVILMDEPASGLIDAELRELDQLIRVLVQQLGICVLLVEHRIELLEAVAENVVVLNLGKVIAIGSPKEVFSNAEVQDAYFEVG